MDACGLTPYQPVTSDISLSWSHFEDPDGFRTPRERSLAGLALDVYAQHLYAGSISKVIEPISPRYEICFVYQAAGTLENYSLYTPDRQCRPRPKSGRTSAAIEQSLRALGRMLLADIPYEPRLTAIIQGRLEAMSNHELLRLKGLDTTHIDQILEPYL